MTTEQEQGFNGWSNYETWLVATWLDNEQDTYFLWRNNAKAAVIQVLNDDAEIRHRQPDLMLKAITALLQQLDEWLQEENPLAGQANVFADLLTATLSEVNHLEIAHHYLDEEAVDAALQEWDANNCPDDEDDEE